ncbi:hypothetical protein NDU88_004298 [Pleurodeles waltl]|uniref:Uncharacterized protein n=1 Tax=Pleurodeles waltl TaxID=8319 RepID=A0AAV7L143_PLEWA|nr:hypothetical protein NDU88_004298 [Pleurodeles waltl]
MPAGRPVGSPTPSPDYRRGGQLHVTTDPPSPTWGAACNQSDCDHSVGPEPITASCTGPGQEPEVTPSPVGSSDGRIHGLLQLQSTGRVRCRQPGLHQWLNVMLGQGSAPTI